MRSSRIERALAVVGAATILVVGFDGLTYAATGSSLILGQLNTADAPTQISNTGVGPALDLRVSSATTPPLQVNSSVVVPNLHAQNADRLGGVTATAFQRRCVPGSILARASTISATFLGDWLATTTPDEYVCAGGRVEIRRVGSGRYEVRFGYSLLPRKSGLTGIPLAQLSATGPCGGGNIGTAMRRNSTTTPPMNYVQVTTFNSGGIPTDCDFKIVLM